MKFSIDHYISTKTTSNKLYSGLGFLGICIIGLFIFFFQFSVNSKTTQKKVNTAKPNVIFIMADDLGYGDLSCYGQTNFKTPNIDKLAEEGMLFTQHYSGSTVCAPSRATLLTGLHTGHVSIRGNKPSENGQMPLPKNTFTLGKFFKNQGYVTGAFGKWGLGNSGTTGDPLHNGFDYFFGYHDQRLAHHYYPYYLWDNDNLMTLEGNQGMNKGQYAPDLIHQKALRFIDKHQKEPFFLFYPTILPHAELAAPKDDIDLLAQTIEDEKPFKGVDEGPDYKEGKYGSQSRPKATFAAMVKVLDDQVGELVQKVKDLGLEENTIFVFTSDNGPHQEGGARPDFFNSNGNLKGLKRDLFEGGIRVPMIVKWKGNFQSNKKSDFISANWDFMITFSELIAPDQNISTDGVSMLPTLKGNPKDQIEHDYLYWEFHERNKKQAIRQKEWKLVVTQLENKPQYHLFNLKTDPSEEQNLVDIYPEKFEELKSLLTEARTPSKEFKFKFYE